MITESDAYRRIDRWRLLWCLLASAILHIVAWSAVTWSGHLSFLRTGQTEDERLLVSPSSIAIERRTAPKPQRHRESIVSSPPQSASISLPADWTKQDYRLIRPATDLKLWLNWTKQSANFIPRVMLWQMPVAEPYMRRASLQDAVQDVLASLRARDAKVYSSKAQRVCDGQRPGWFFSYVKPDGDPPLRVEETLFMAGETIYRATYIRPADQPEDPQVREALNTLCAL